jgi:hypothetical protein
VNIAYSAIEIDGDGIPRGAGGVLGGALLSGEVLWGNCVARHAFMPSSPGYHLVRAFEAVTPGTANFYGAGHTNLHGLAVLLRM